MIRLFHFCTIFLIEIVKKKIISLFISRQEVWGLASSATFEINEIRWMRLLTSQRKSLHVTFQRHLSTGQMERSTKLRKEVETE